MLEIKSQSCEEMIELYEEIHDFQFDLMNAMASVTDESREHC